MYYVLGAMWMPAIMGLGSLALVSPQRLVLWFTLVVVIVGAFGTTLFWQSPVSVPALAAVNGGAGTGVVQVGLWLVPLITLSTFGATAVASVALVSAWRASKRRAPAQFFYGNLWLAVGVAIISLAGSAARLGWPQAFWVAMFVGWVLTYVGYHMLTPRVAAPAHLVSMERTGE